MSRLDQVLKKLQNLIRTDNEENPLDVINAYKRKFGTVPTIVGLPVSISEAVAVLREAMKNDKPLTEEEWYKALGVKAPPPGAMT